MNIEASVNKALQYMDDGQEEECVHALRQIYNSVVDNISKTKSHYKMREAYLLSNTFNVMQVKIKDDVDMQLLTDFGFMLANTVGGLNSGIGDECMYLRSAILAMTIRGGRHIKRTILQLFKNKLFEPNEINDGIDNYLIIETYFLFLAYYHFTRHSNDEIILGFYIRWGSVIENTFSSSPYNMSLVEVEKLGKRVHQVLYKYLLSRYKIQITS